MERSKRRTLKLTVVYEGAGYAGWQAQVGSRTLQETLEKAVAKVTGQPVRVLASGRTDAGVHAAGQVVALRTESALPPNVLLRAINANLPDDIAVIDVAEAAADFHPIRDAVRKRYRYTIHDGPIRPVFERHFVWHYRYGRLDAEAMQRAASALLGTHDFSSFETSGAPRKTSIRTVFELSIQRGRAGDTGRGQHTIEPAKESIGPRAFHAPYESDEQGRAGDRNLINIEIEADGFLYNMVRAIVGTLVEVGRGDKPISWPGEVLAAADRRQAGPTAPPQGLCLVNVVYEADKGRAGDGNADLVKS